MAKKFKRLIVHVGMHKTGSTTLQHMLKKLRRGSAERMDMIDTNHSVGCSMWFGSVLKYERTLLNFGHSPASAERHLNRIKKRVARQLERSSCDELVISSEWLSDGGYEGEGRRGALRRLREEFEPHFERIEIYGYVRPPVGFTTSATQEIMKMRPFFMTPWAGYRRRFGPLRDIFGRENVHLRLFKRDRLKDQDIMTDFQDWVGWTPQPYRIKATNLSMTAAGAALVHCYQRNRGPIETVRHHRQKVRAVAKLGKVGGPKFVLSQPVQHSLLTEHADDLAWMEKILREPINDHKPDPQEPPWAVGDLDDLKRCAARFAPLLFGEAAQEPPDDPDRADAMAWDAIRQKFRL